MLFSICELYANRRREGRKFLIGVTNYISVRTVTTHDRVVVYSTLLNSVCVTSPRRSASLAILLINSSCDNIRDGNVLETYEIAGLADYFRTTLK
jgi:hypothetical protein